MMRKYNKSVKYIEILKALVVTIPQELHPLAIFVI